MVHVMLVAKQAWASKTQPCMQMGGNELEEVLWLFEVVQWAMAEGGLGGMGRQHSCLHAVPKNEIWRGVSVSSFDARSSSTLQRRRSHTLSALLPSGSEIWEWTHDVTWIRRSLWNHPTSWGRGRCFKGLGAQVRARTEDHRRHGRRAGALPARTGP